MVMKKLLALYRHFADKRYSTIAGTLVYFLLMSIAPTLLWLALIAGRIDLQGMVSHTFFKAIEPILNYLNSAAQDAASGAGIVLLATSLYSSTNFFYHLRRSGEIIYDCERGKGGVKLRLAAAGIVLAVIVCFSAVAAVLIACAGIVDLMPRPLADCISLTVLAVGSFNAALLLNLFACPFRLYFRDALPGSLLTTALWLVLAAGFTVYMNFADPSRLYGAVAAVIVFLLWCYVMTSSLVIGVIYNSTFVAKRRTALY